MDRAGWKQKLWWVERHAKRTRKALQNFPKMSDTTVAVRFHIDLKMVPVLEALSRLVELIIIPCHSDTTDPAGWEHLASHSEAKLREEWQSDLLQEYSDRRKLFLCDLGGEMIGSAITSGLPVCGAMEGTTSGLKLLANLKEKATFPIIDWNGAPLKLQIHNEKMVGFSLWQTFSEVTRLSLHGKTVGVFGFGLVGRGIARAARGLGGIVRVHDLSAECVTCAEFEGFECLDPCELAASDVIVTATGADGVLTKQLADHMRDGAILLNAGHHASEISAYYRDHASRRERLPHVEEISLDDERSIYLLARGRLLNLAAGFGDTINGFDITSMLLVNTLARLLREHETLPNGLVP